MPPHQPGPCVKLCYQGPVNHPHPCRDFVNPRFHQHCLIADQTPPCLCLLHGPGRGIMSTPGTDIVEILQCIWIELEHGKSVEAMMWHAMYLWVEG